VEVKKNLSAFFFDIRAFKDNKLGERRTEVIMAYLRILGLQSKKQREEFVFSVSSAVNINRCNNYTLQCQRERGIL
jgi:hypothetical protein